MLMGWGQIPFGDDAGQHLNEMGVACQERVLLMAADEAQTCGITWKASVLKMQ